MLVAVIAVLAVAFALALVLLLSFCMLRSALRPRPRPRQRRRWPIDGDPSASEGFGMRYTTLPPCIEPAIDGATRRVSTVHGPRLASPDLSGDPTSLRPPIPAKEWPRPPPLSSRCLYGADATWTCRT
jgi:hypothetical protein